MWGLGAPLLRGGRPAGQLAACVLCGCRGTQRLQPPLCSRRHTQQRHPGDANAPQKWFLLEFFGTDAEIDLSCSATHHKREFSCFAW